MIRRTRKAHLKDLTAKLKEWVAAGIIDERQADLIRSHEAPTADEQRIPLIAEVLGYLGGTLALVALSVLIGEAWDDFGSWTRLIVVAIGTAVFLAAGWVIRPNKVDAIRRLSSFLWALGAIGVAFWFGLFSDEILGVSEDTTVLVASLAGLAVAFGLYRLSLHSLQQVVLGAGVLATAMSTIAQIHEPNDWIYGLVIWGLGLAWLAMGWRGFLPPKRTAYALGCVALLIGPQSMWFDSTAWPLLLGVVSAAALLTLSVALRDTILLGFGAAGVFLFAPQVIFEFFGDTLGAPLALFLTGVTMLGAAILVARLRTEVVSDDD